MSDAIDSIDDRLDSSTLQTSAGIKYLLMEGFPTGSFEEHTAACVEKYIIRQEDLLDFLVESFGGYVSTPLGVQYTNHRRMPGFESALTRRVDFEPFLPGLPSDPFLVDPRHATNSSITRGFSKYYTVTISYQAGGESNSKRNNNNNEDPDPNDPETFVSVHGDAAGEFINSLGVPTNIYNIELGGYKPWDNPLVFIVPETQWTVTWNFIPDNYFRERLLPEMRIALGTVNRGRFNRVLFEADSETMLFAGFSMTQEFSWRYQVQNVLAGRTLGTPTINVEMKFIEKNVGRVPTNPNKADDNDPHEIGGHNHIYKSKVGWIRVFRGVIQGEKADNKNQGAQEQHPLYALANHDRLFFPRLNPPSQLIANVRQ